jgi:3-oxoacyl-[acyl-carrier-protein] synthase-3
MTNDMLAEKVDTSNEWIVSRTGIHSRHIAEEETVRSLAVEAARRALDAAGIERDRVSLVICATVQADRPCPALSCYLQSDLGLPTDILAFDLNAACSGFIYALITAQGLLTPGSYALIVGSEVLSRVTDFTDRSTCVLFGDGAGAAVVEGTTAPFHWTSSVRGDDEALTIQKYIEMDGQAVFKFAVEVLAQGIRDVAAKAEVALEDIDRLVCHQANERILTSAAKRLNLPVERFFMNLGEYGNTSAASVPLALDEAVRSGAIEPGQRIILAGFGGGLTSGAIYMDY